MDGACLTSDRKRVPSSGSDTGSTQSLSRGGSVIGNIEKYRRLSVYRYHIVSAYKISVMSIYRLISTSIRKHYVSWTF